MLHVPDEEALTWRYPKRAGESVKFGYPLLRLVVLVECGTRALMAAASGPESDGELTCAGRLLSVLDRTMLLLADAGFDGAEFARDVQATGAQFLVRSSARRTPTPFRHLGDGSCLARIGYGVLPVLLTVRVIEASVTVTLADGTDVISASWSWYAPCVFFVFVPKSSARPWIWVTMSSRCCFISVCAKWRLFASVKFALPSAPSGRYVW